MLLLSILGYVTGPQLITHIQGMPVPIALGPNGGYQSQGKVK